MHPLLNQGSVEAGRLYDSVIEKQLDWAKLRVSSLPSQFSNSEFLRVLKNGTKVISVEQFKSSFTKTVQKLKSVLNSGRWFAVLMSCEEEKHNDVNRSLYFFLLALEVCPEIGTNLQGILHLPKRFRLSDFFTDFSYVCFDDAVLSGVNIESCFKPVSNMPRIVVTPFVSEIAKEFLGNLGVEVIHTDVVRQFVKIDPSRSNTVDFKYEAYPLYFSHRSFQSATGFPEVYDGLSGQSNISPPFSSKKYSRYDYLVRDIVKEFVS